MKSAFIIYCHFLVCLTCQGLQAQSVSGRVYDATNYEPLPSAAIINLNDSTGTTTNDEGFFTLKTAGNGPVYLSISHLGYTSRLIPLSGNDGFLHVGLQAAETNLQEVVVSASQINKKLLEVPGSVNIITRKQLERNNQTTITPSLNRVPGVYMHTGGLNTNRITIRGMGARTPYGTNKVRAYFGDIPLTSGDGETALEDVDLNAIQRIEVIKGPTSSIYGAGLGGTINIIPGTGVQGTQAEVKSHLGSYGLARNSFQYTSSGTHTQLGVTYADTHLDGYRENSQYDRRSFVASGHHYAGEKSMLSFLGTYTHLKAFIPSSLNEVTFRTNPSAAATTWREAKGYEAYNKASMGLSYHYDLNNHIKNITSVFLHFRNADEPRPFDILRENTVATGVRSRIIAETAVLNKEITISTGFEYFSDWYNWSTYENLYQQNPGTGSIAGNILSNNKEQRNYYNIFAQFDLQLTKELSLQSGLNVNRTHYELMDLYRADNINQTGAYEFKSIWSPRAGLTYKVTDHHALYITAGHGFSPPGLAETLTPEGRINVNIQPETGWNYEIGSKGSWFDGRLYAELAFYRMDIKNLLVAQRTGPDTYVGVNAGRTIHDGLEALLHFEMADGKQWSIKPYFSASLMHYKFETFRDGDNDYSGNDLTGVPSGIFNIGLDVSSDLGLYFYSNYRHVGQIPLNDANSVYSEGYGLLNCKAGYQFQLWKNFHMNLAAGANNITDEAYASMVLVNAVGFGGAAPRYYYPGLPRNYYASLALKYAF